MEFQVKDIGSIEPKSIQEVEEALLKKQSEDFSNEPLEKTIIPDDPEVPELKDEDVLSYFEKKYNRKLTSVDELLATPKEAEELPSDVAAFNKYKKETGRGIDDYVRLNRDFTAMEPNDLLSEYLSATEEGLDKSDVADMLAELNPDEDEAEEADMKKAKLAKKKMITQAKKYFAEQKEKYSMPLESSQASISGEDAEDFKAYKQYLTEATTQQQESEKKRDWFLKKTDELFSSDFKGFDFSLENNGTTKKITYAPADVAETKKAQLSPMNFINKYMDEKGLIKDAAGYHKALAVAMNPERFAKFFYEQGKADQTDDMMRTTKNIKMSEQKIQEVVNKGGTQVKSLNNDTGNSLKIRSSKKA